MKLWIFSLKGGMELTSLNVNISLYPEEHFSVFSDKPHIPYLQSVTQYISCVTSLLEVFKRGDHLSK